MVCSSLKNIRSGSACLAAPYGEKSFIHSLVRITPRHKQDRHAKSRPVPSKRGDIRQAHGISQPPDQRTYSVEVTSFLSNLLHHRRLRPKQALDYDITDTRQCQAQITQKSLCSQGFSVPLPKAGRRPASFLLFRPSRYYI